MGRNWRERRFASRVCSQLLDLYREARQARPGLEGRDLYRHVVARYLTSTAATADRVLQAAEVSFAEWPVTRPLRFRDVVHFLAVDEFLASRKDSTGWTGGTVGRVVSARISADL